MVRQKLSKLWCKGSPPVITKKDAPFFLAVFISLTMLSIDVKG